MARKHTRSVQVLRVIRSRILRGAYRGKLPGVRALAKEMGSNPTTVQVALAKLESLGLVRKVERGGTFVVPGSQGDTGKTGLFARLALPPPFGTESEEGSSWADFVIYGFHSAARRHGLEMSLEYCSTADAVVDRILDDADSERCVGTVFLITRLQTSHLVRLAESRSPVVAADRALDDPMIPYVTFDNVGAGRLAAEHLVTLGHRRIGCMAYARTGPGVSDRIAGAQQYLDGCGLSLRHLICEGNRAKFLARISEGPDSCTALINMTGFEEVLHLRRMMLEAGKRLPQDLSRISIVSNDLRQRGVTTCVLLQDQRMGETALEMLLDEELLANPRHVFVPLRLADHGTTCPPGGRSRANHGK